MLNWLNIGISETISLMKRRQQQQLVEVAISLKVVMVPVVAGR